jgi:hypothetical protein
MDPGNKCRDDRRGPPSVTFAGDDYAGHVRGLHMNDAPNGASRAAGFEHGGQGALANVPYRVAMASMLQALASAALIFLFLLAVRNLLRLH